MKYSANRLASVFAVLSSILMPVLCLTELPAQTRKGFLHEIPPPMQQRENTEPGLFFDKAMVRATLILPNHAVKMTARSSGVAMVSPVQLGRASNAYTILRDEQNQVVANDSLGLVSFIHRHDVTIWGGGGTENGKFRYDVSIDGGATFVNDIGTMQNVYVNFGRYPNISLYNPAGNTNPFAAKAVYTGPTNGFPTPGWVGHVYGVSDLTLTNPPATTEHYLFDSENTYLPGGLTQGLPGEFWQVEQQRAGAVLMDSIRVMKGTWNTSTNDVDWETYVKIDADYDRSATGSPAVEGPNIAFSPDGMTGWIGYLSNLNTSGSGNDSALYPCLIKSSDGGASWGTPIEVNLDSISWIADSLQTLWRIVDSNGDTIPASDGRATCAFEFDITVDAYGCPHLAVPVGTVGATQPFSISSDLAMFIADIVSPDGGDNWVASYVSPILCFGGEFGVGDPLSMDNFVQVSRNESGDKVFYSWVDTDTALITGNQNGVGFGETEQTAPNLRIAGWRLSDGYKTCPQLVTDEDLVWEGRILFPTMAPTVLTDAGTGDSKLPIVFEELISANDPLQPCRFWYLGNDAVLSDSDFVNQNILPLSWDEILNGCPELSRNRYLVQSRQSKYGLQVYFAPPDYYTCSGYEYEWNFGDGRTDTVCQPINVYDTIGKYNVNLIIRDSLGNFVKELGLLQFVGCPDPQTRFVVEQIGDSIHLKNLTTSDSSWDSSWLPITYQWEVASQTYTSDSPILTYNTIFSDTCLELLQLTATSGCGAEEQYIIEVNCGYNSDLPTKKYAHPVSSIGYTPMYWKKPGAEFPTDMNNNKVDDALELANNPKDILVYYFVQDPFDHEEVRTMISNAIPNGGLDRWCKYLTLGVFEDVPPSEIVSLSSLPFVAHIGSDEPTMARTSINSNLAFLRFGEMQETLGIANSSTSNCNNSLSDAPIPRGAGIGIGIIGGGRNNHFSFASLPCLPCLDCGTGQVDSTKAKPYWSFIGEGNSPDSSCIDFLTVHDEEGTSSGSASILTTQNLGEEVGLAPMADYYFLKVVDNDSMARPSDIVQAFEWAIRKQADSPHVNILICDFDLNQPGFKHDAISSISGLAAQNHIMVIAGTGMEGQNGMTSPGLRAEVMTPSPWLSSGCDNSYQIASNAGRDPGPYGLKIKPNISSPSQVLAANPMNQLYFDHPVASSQISGMVSGGLAALVCERAPHLNNFEAALLLSSSAGDCLSNSSPGFDDSEGNGKVDFQSAIAMLNSLSALDLGFEENTSSIDWYVRHHSKDVEVLVHPVNAVSPGPVVHPGDTINIKVTIHNFSNSDYDESTESGSLLIGVQSFSNGVHLGDIVRYEKLPDIPAQGSVSITLGFISEFEVEGICVGAEIVSLADTNSYNNIAKRNDYRIASISGGSYSGQAIVYGMDSDSFYLGSRNTGLGSSGYVFSSDFVPGWYSRDSFPRVMNFTFSHSGGPPPPIFKYNISFWAYTTGPDTIYNGGLNFTLYDQMSTEIRDQIVTDLGKVLVFPVPATDLVKVEFELESSGEAKIELIDLAGRILQSRNVEALEGANRIEEFDISSLAQGLYFIRVSLGGAVVGKRFVKI